MRDQTGVDRATSSGAAARFAILGPLEVWIDENRRPLGGHRQERVLATLLLNPGQAVSLTRLVESVWGLEPPATARHQVRKIMGELRQLLGSDLIVTDGPGYRIDLRRDQLDHLQFQWHLRQIREPGCDAGTVRQHLWEALRLWRGPALSGVDGPLIVAAAVILDQSRVDTLERLAAITLTAQDAADIIPELQQLVTEHPLRETLRAQLMVALYRAGRQADALAVYDDARRLLRDELGVDPGPQLSRLHEQVLRNDPSLLNDPDTERPAESADSGTPAESGEPVEPDSAEPGPMTVVATLPYDISDFTGRRIEMSALLTIVPEAAQQALTIVTIDGMAGVGKSALAIHAAHRLAKRFPDGQLFIDLNGYTSGRSPVDPVDALDTLLRAIGIPGDRIPDDLISRSALWRSQIAGRRIVLLLDNAAESAQVRDLMPGTPGSLVLVTSRARLAALDGAVPISLAPPSLDESRALVTRLLDAERAEAEPTAVDELIDVCGALPLALRVAAARLNNRPQWTIARLVERLRSAERNLDELAVDDRSVAAAFRLSYDGLGPDQQRIFRLLSLHPAADFGPHTTAALAEISLEKSEDLLEDLLDARLLEQRLPGRYTYHNLFRSYARQTAREDEGAADRERALLRLYDYAVLTLRKVALLIKPGMTQTEFHCAPPSVALPTVADAAAAYSFLDQEWAGFAALAKAAPELGLDLHACHLACDLERYLQVRGQYRVQLELLNEAVAAAIRLDDLPNELRALVSVYVPQKHFGQLEDAQRSTDRAREIAEQLGDLSAQGMLLSRLGGLLTNRGQYAEGLQHHLQAHVIHHENGNIRLEAMNLIGIAVAQDELGHYPQALESERAALLLANRLGDENLELVALINIANTQENQDQYDEALATLARTQRILAQNDYPLAAAIVDRSNAEISRKIGKLDEAIAYARNSRAALVELGSSDTIASIDNIIGKIHYDSGDFAAALESHRMAWHQAREIGILMQVVQSLNGMGRAQQALGDNESARDSLQRALRAAEEIKAPDAEQIAAALNAIP